MMNGREIPNPPNTQAPLSLPPNTPPYFDVRANALQNGPDKAFMRAQQDVDLLNHCFEDIEVFMGKLQQAAEAQSVLEQRNKKKKSRRKKSPEDDLLSAKARAPPEAEFIQIFQKFKYCFSLLARLKSAIANPSSEDLLHHLYKPLDMIVKATGGPALAASVSSPALTTGAVDLLKNTLTLQEHTLWTSLGPYWTYPRSALRGPVPPYSPVFLDGWRLPGSEVEGWVDPIEEQHSKDADRERQESVEQSAAVQYTDEIDGGVPLKERYYRCSYDFVARNSSELSVLHGDTLEVIESSKRWWKCKNRFNEVGFVPFNILEPVSHIESPPKAPAPPPLMKMTPVAPPSPHAVTSHPNPNPHRPRSSAIPPQHLPEDTEKVMQVNDELLQRLTNGKGAFPRPLVIPRSADTSVPLDYHSPPAEVEAWLRGKGFSDPTVQCLRVLTGAQLFSLNKEELRAVIPEEGARVYSQLTVQKSLLEDVRKATELETVMEKQKMKVDLKAESGTL
ncbi:epidermal growth factor receptor kinase substrate 8-like protein 1 isoform X2 [Brachyhypopomus gauderio]